MAIVNLSKQEHETITQKIQHYFKKEMDQEIGQFDAAFLLNFFSEEIGPYFYNSALHDAQAILRRRMDDISNAIDELEKPTDSRG